MELVTKRIGDALVIYLEGKFDLQLAIEVESKINEILDRGEIYLVFDLEKVKYISSSGLRIFIATMRRLKASNGEMKISHMTPQIRKFFEVVGLIDLLSIYDTPEAAAADFSTSS